MPEAASEPAGDFQGSGSAHASRRVLVVALQPFYSDRGTPIAVRRLLEALSELGYEPDILTYPVVSSPEIPGSRSIPHSPS